MIFQGLIRRKRGRPKRDDTATSESSPVKKVKQQHLLTDSPRRSSRTASQSVNNRIAVQTVRFLVPSFDFPPFLSNISVDPAKGRNTNQCDWVEGTKDSGPRE